MSCVMVPNPNPTSFPTRSTCTAPKTTTKSSCATTTKTSTTTTTSTTTIVTTAVVSDGAVCSYGIYNYFYPTLVPYILMSI